MTAPYGEPQPFPELPQVTIDESERLERHRAAVSELLTSVAVVVGWFAALGALGALVWLKVTTLPEYTLVVSNGQVAGSMGEEELAKQFGANGWFLVIAVVGGLLSGVVLMLVRRASPVVMVVLVGLGGALATFVMLQCGLAWGPEDYRAALARAQLGDSVPVQLKIDVNAAYYTWSIAALVGATLALWFLDARNPQPLPARAADDQPVLTN